MLRVDPDHVTAIIREVAANDILPFFQHLEKNQIGYKIGDDPVTVADKQAESALESRLKALLPGSNVLGEEAFAVNPGILRHLSTESPVWIIDPIDGTRNFVAGSDQFGVIVALSQKNQTIAGWLYSPTSDEVVTVELGAGAWYKGQRLKMLPPRSWPEMRGYLGDRLIAAYEKNHRADIVDPVFELMHVGIHEYVNLGVDGLQFGHNKQQRHFRASMAYATPWDDAAGILMHSEAGGYAAFWGGEPYQPHIMHRGLACAPDKESWLALKAWCQTFTELPQHGESHR